MAASQAERAGGAGCACDGEAWRDPCTGVTAVLLAGVEGLLPPAIRAAHSIATRSKWSMDPRRFDLVCCGCSGSTCGAAAAAHAISSIIFALASSRRCRLRAKNHRGVHGVVP